MLNRLTDGSAWLPLVGFLLLLLALAGAELWRPLRRRGNESAGRIPGNIGMGLINAALALFLPLSTVLAAQWAAERGVGLMNQAPPPLIAAVATTILVRSLAVYLFHRAAHRLSWLWRVHRVHHADTCLDLSTGLRNHPVELAFVVPWLAAVTIALGLHAPTLLFYEGAGLAFALWDHANLDVPPWLDRLLRLVVVTPAMHHVHHSAARAETDSNYGDMLSLWDRMFGTYRALDRDSLRAMRIGLGDGFDSGASSLFHQLRLPLLDPAPLSEARQEGGDVGAERVDRIAAFHDDECGQAQRVDPPAEGGIVGGLERER
jgi:sterol desaturase/sphingolipid hydroxylase (fatty acid hydroxylase superfamily)